MLVKHCYKEIVNKRRHVCTKYNRNQMIFLEDMAEKVEICLTLLKFLIKNENQSFFAANT